MLESLKRRLILIVMLLAGLVLVGSLALSLFTTWAGQNRMINDALTRTANSMLDYVPTIGGAASGPGDPGAPEGMLTLAVDVSNTGVVLEVSNSPAYIDTDVLTEVIETALASASSTGHLSTYHVSWMCRQTLDGYRIALADTSMADQAMSLAIRRDVIIGLLGLALLYAVAHKLATMAVKPVEEAWDRQRRFVADASHELKTPLAVIMANTEILMRSKDLKADEKNWLSSTASESQQMKSLVNDLLQLARTDEAVAGSAAPLERHDIDLTDLVTAAAMEFDAIAFEHGCTIEPHVTPNIHVQGDLEWLRRMVRILIDNACKYATPGTSVKVMLCRQGQRAQIVVNNRGNVIAPADLPHVFERFYRSNSARTHNGSGSFGLGLAIAKGIVDAHGGTISVTSNEREGTSFSAVL